MPIKLFEKRRKNDELKEKKSSGVNQGDGQPHHERQMTTNAIIITEVCFNKKYDLKGFDYGKKSTLLNTKKLSTFCMISR